MSIQRWRKLGRVFCPAGDAEWTRSHAANPVAHPLGGDLFRIYFSTRDKANRSSVGWVEIDLRHPGRVLRRAERPALAPGPLGSFDDSGCSVGCLVPQEGRLLLYYMGWNLGVTVPWRNSIGAAVSDDGLSFERVSAAPLLDRSAADPYTLSYPWVVREGGAWRMWYGSNLRWGAEKSDMFHMLKHASSADGRSWSRDGKVVLHPRDEGEYAFARPCVLRDGDLYKMWYAFRGEGYRIGYAESPDGISWTRKDEEAGIAPSEEGWDRGAVEYPSLFDHGGNRYMLYCGEGYGRSGFGLAVLETA